MARNLSVTARLSSGEIAHVSAVCVLVYKGWSHNSQQFVKIFRCHPAEVSVCILFMLSYLIILIIGTYLSHKMRINTEVRSSTYPLSMASSSKIGRIDVFDAGKRQLHLLQLQC